MSFLLLALSLLIQAPVATAKTQQPPLQTDRFARDVHDKNVGDILSIVTPKAVLITADDHTYKGTDELRKAYDDMLGRYDTDLQLERTSFGQTDTFGIEHGTFTQRQRDRVTGNARETRGTYVFLHERQPNGEWHIAHQKWTPTT